MRFHDFILKNVARRKVRSALTGIGVAIGITAVVALLGITRGFEKSVVESYESHGVDMVVLRTGVAERLNSSLDQDIGPRLAQFDEVAKVMPSLSDNVTIDGSALGAPIHGWQPGSPLFNDLRVATGRKLEAGDDDRVMLGGTLAKNLEKKVGDKVAIEPHEFEVVGIFESPAMFENAAAVTLLTTLQELMDRPGHVNEFQLVLKPDLSDRQQAMEDLKNRIEDLRDETGNKLGLAALTTDAFVRGHAEIRMAQAMAWVTSVIALIIGSVGVLNTMVMSVLERTQEIGILRAIGWRKLRIVRMILWESFAISMLGAIFGTIMAMLIVGGLSGASTVQGYLRPDISPGVIGIGFLLSLGVGIVGGAYPAFRGASLPPTEALRYE